MLLQLVLPTHLRLANQARQVGKTLRRVACTASDEPLGGFFVAADVARLAFRSLRAFLDRLRASLGVLLVGMILLRASAPLDAFT